VPIRPPVQEPEADGEAEWTEPHGLDKHARIYAINPLVPSKPPTWMLSTNDNTLSTAFRAVLLYRYLATAC